MSWNNDHVALVLEEEAANRRRQIRPWMILTCKEKKTVLFDHSVFLTLLAGLARAILGDIGKWAVPVQGVISEKTPREVHLAYLRKREKTTHSTCLSYAAKRKLWLCYVMCTYT